MPTNIRAILSVIVVLVTALVFYFEHRADNGTLAWFVLALGVFMVGAVWLFPEAKRSEREKRQSQ